MTLRYAVLGLDDAERQAMVSTWADASASATTADSAIGALRPIVGMSSIGDTARAPAQYLAATRGTLAGVYVADTAADAEPLIVGPVSTSATDDDDRLFAGLNTFLRRARVELSSVVPSEYEVSPSGSLGALVQSNPYVQPLLRVIPDRVAYAFGHPQPLRLEVVTDPDDASEMLFVTIRTRDGRAAAREALARFDNMWWREASKVVDGALAVTLAFV